MEDAYAKLAERLRRYGRVPNETDNDTENTEKADGANLAIGSPEYMEMLRDRSGMNEHEQKAAQLAGEDVPEVNEISDSDRWQRDLRKRNSKAQEERVAAREAEDDGRLTTAERDISHQVRKMDAVEDVIEKASIAAAATPDTADDEFVSDRLSELLAEQVYDNEVSDDFDFPGGSVFKKYF